MPVRVGQLHLWHLPKTGGTWARRAIEAAGIAVHPAGPEHARPPRELDGLHAVILRQPFDWYWSVWRYLRKPGQESDPALYLPLMQRGMTRADLADGAFRQFWVRQRGYYSQWVREFTPPGMRILRTESLAGDLIKLLGEVFPGRDVRAILDHPPENVGAKLARPVGLESLVNEAEPAYWLAIKEKSV